MFDDEAIYETAYEWADGDEDLPWHRESLPPILHAYLGGVSEPKTVLDLGSGTGTMAVALAERGHEVLGIDFMEDAVERGRRRADERGVDVEFVHADILEWDPPGTFEIVLDCGLLHGLAASDIDRYNDRLLEVLADDGDYFLSHFIKRHALDWGLIGPTRRRRESIADLLPDELTLEAYAFETVPTVFKSGPTARYGHFWWTTDSETP